MYFGGSFTWGDFQFLLYGAVTTIAITLVSVADRDVSRRPVRPCQGRFSLVDQQHARCRP